MTEPTELFPRKASSAPPSIELLREVAATFKVQADAYWHGCAVLLEWAADAIASQRDSLSETQSQLDGAKAVAEVVVRTAVGMGLYDGAASISGNKIIDLVKAMREKADYAEEIIRLVGEETAKAGKLHTEARRVMAMNEPAFAAVYCTLCELRDRIAALKRKTENANEHQASAVDVAAPQNVVLLGVRRADAAGPPVVRGEELRGRFAGAMVERGGGWVKVQRLSDEDADALVALLNGRTEIGILGEDKGSPDGDCTVKGYRDAEGRIHITSVERSPAVVPGYADGMERAAQLCEEEAESARALLNENPHIGNMAKDRIAGIRDAMRTMANTIRAFRDDEVPVPSQDSRHVIKSPLPGILRDVIVPEIIDNTGKEPTP